jgi:hypothetical protein
LLVSISVLVGLAGDAASSLSFLQALNADNTTAIITTGFFHAAAWCPIFVRFFIVVIFNFRMRELFIGAKLIQPGSAGEKS